MTGLAYGAGAFAALMIIIAICCSCRLVAQHLKHRASEADVDALHILMGAAMAGMFEPRLNLVPSTVWQAVFAVATAWFAIPAIRARSTRGHFGSAHPLPHAVESAAMIYMLRAPEYHLESGQAGLVMSTMTGPAGASSRNPVIPLVLALFMLGYILWTAEHLASMQLASRLSRLRDSGRSLAGAPETSEHAQQGTPVLAPRLAASYKIMMGIAMGYMLVSML